jgi:hypothetical protein
VPVFERADKFATGKKPGTVSASFAWKIPGEETLLIENRKMTFYSNPQLRIIDFDITLSPQVEVKFGDTKEGMFGHPPCRGARRGTAQGCPGAQAHRENGQRAEQVRREKCVW